MENNSTTPQTENVQQPQPIIVQVEHKSNGMGTAGFVFALLWLFFCWVPILNCILWALGTLFSIIGVLRKPRGLAIAGLVISCLGIILRLIILLCFGAALAGAAVL